MTKQPAPIDPRHVANVVTTVLAATEAERAGGMLWYATYRQRVIEQGAACGLTDEQSLALFAVLSQQTPIARSFSNFVIVATTRDPDQTVATLGKMRAKCAAILADADNPGPYATGPKISSFLRNMSGDAHPVCVDGHAVSMVYNRMIDQVGSKYDYCGRVIAAAAAILGLKPRECQAIGWISWRRQKGIVDNDGVVGA